MSPILASTTFMLIAFLSLPLLTINISVIPLHIENFYSHSFIPDALKIDYEVERHISIYYNVTAFRPFPGQLLMNLFIRRYNDIQGKPSEDIFKQRNLDFCKTLDILRNVTNDLNARSFLLQDTFVTSCPLVNGFYYIQNGTIPNNIVPWFIRKGRYIVNFELIQVIDELVKLMNLRFILIVNEDVEYTALQGHGNGGRKDSDNDNDSDSETGNDNEYNSDYENDNEDENDNDDENGDDNENDNENNNGNENEGANENNSDNEENVGKSNDSGNVNDDGNAHDDGNENNSEHEKKGDDENTNENDNENTSDNREYGDKNNNSGNDGNGVHDNNNDNGNEDASDNDNNHDMNNGSGNNDYEDNEHLNM